MQRCAGFGHLHQRCETFLHTRTARSRHADEGTAVGRRATHALHEAFAHHGAHRTADKAEFKRRYHHRLAVQFALHHHQRIVFAGRFAGSAQTFGVFFAVLEFQNIGRLHRRTDFFAVFTVEQHIQPLARGDGFMVSAFRADIVVLLHIGGILRRPAGSAFAPQTFGNARFSVGFLDFRRKDFV